MRKLSVTLKTILGIDKLYITNILAAIYLTMLNVEYIIFCV